VRGLDYSVLVRIWPALCQDHEPCPFRAIAACGSVELARAVIRSHPARRALEWEIRFLGELLESGNPEYRDCGAGI
jgi:hypothetical protein